MSETDLKSVVNCRTFQTHDRVIERSKTCLSVEFVNTYVEVTEVSQFAEDDQ